LINEWYVWVISKDRLKHARGMCECIYHFCELLIENRLLGNLIIEYFFLFTEKSYRENEKKKRVNKAPTHHCQIKFMYTRSSIYNRWDS
jgi:hypothetical protein